MEQVQINPYRADLVPELRKHLKALPSDAKVCPTHGEEVVIGADCNYKGSGYSGSLPPWETYFQGCCQTAIGNVQQALLFSIDR